MMHATCGSRRSASVRAFCCCYEPALSFNVPSNCGPWCSLVHAAVRTLFKLRPLHAGSPVACFFVWILYREAAVYVVRFIHSYITHASCETCAVLAGVICPDLVGWLQCVTRISLKCGIKEARLAPHQWPEVLLCRSGVTLSDKGVA